MWVVGENVEAYVVEGWTFFVPSSFCPLSLAAGMVMCKTVLVSLWSPCTAEDGLPSAMGLTSQKSPSSVLKIPSKQNPPNHDFLEIKGATPDVTWVSVAR